MRRNYPPYNGKRYLLNAQTNELHDLDKETANCQISEISQSHIKMFDTIQEAQVYLIFMGKSLNGCYWCLRSLDKG